MVFSSTVFLFLFLPCVLLAYVLVPMRVKNVLLLGASLIFYAWGEGGLVLLLLASSAFNYVIARIIASSRHSHAGATLLAVGVSANLSLLLYYKYATFLIHNYNALAPLPGFAPVVIDEIRLPIGISFFTFQSISYLVDVYRGTADAQRRFVDAALYIALFPQLIAGPIVRYGQIATQLRERHLTLDLFSDGVRRFVIGLGKKVLVANPLGAVADQVFAIPGNELTWGVAWLGALCYAFQIYFDFSGYSDMAIGLGRMFGFSFPENFNYPYVSRSIREFWRRWHISLSSWFRDYVYVPLGGNRVGSARHYANLVIVFALCGLWHGASWTFLVWGLYHGLFLVAERLGLDRHVARLWQPAQHLYALLVVLVGWVFFRADDLPYALSFLRAMVGAGAPEGAVHPLGLYLTTEVAFTLTVAAVASTGALQSIARSIGRPQEHREDIVRALPSPPLWQRLGEPVYLLLVLVVASAYLAAGTYNPFIYFRF
jgi:alginate O-acetyltransferase complex protein AlgI